MARKKGGEELKLSNLDIRKTAVPTRLIKRARVGKRYKLSLLRFIHRMFQLNEVAKISHRMTDGEIARQVRIEYPNNKRVQEKFKETQTNDLAKVMNRYRSEYNRGKLLSTEPPPKERYVSFPYDEEGMPINNRFVVPKRMTAEEVAAKRKKYKKHLEAWNKKHGFTN